MLDRPLILLVDDEPIFRRTLGELLRASGWNVEEANDGAAALALAPRIAPLLVLLDIGLPDCDGFEVCSQLRALPGFEETPVLMLTGRDDAESIRRAFEVGATDFVTKLVAPALIVNRVRFMLRAAGTVMALKRSETRLAEAQRIARMGNWELDVATGMVAASAETFRLLRLPESAGEHPLALVRASIVAEQREGFDRTLAATIACAVTESAAARRFDGEFHIVAPAGRSRVVRLIGEVECNPSGSCVRVLGTAQDLTELVETREQIRTLAYYDALTGLPNRLLFVDQARSALDRTRRRGDKTALMVLDLDNFKRINDSHGHDAGDEVLRAVGARLREAVRQYDGMARDSEAGQVASVARMGGDEFLLSVSDLTDVEQAATVASRLLDALREPVALSSGPLHVSGSIGVSLFPDDGDSFEAVLKHADIALYQAKEAGRNAFAFFDRTMNAVATQRMMLESSLRDAVERGTMTIAVQPKVDGRTRALIGGEALLRWDHAVHGAVPPKVFVALAERIGLASLLTTMLVEKVCQHMVAWRDSGLLLVPIAINIAAQLFRDPEAVRAICRIPLTHGIEPRLIEFEITETALIDDPKRAALVLAELRRNGYRVTLDDFGTGYSSLSHLREFSVDVLKVDGSFVQELQRNRKDAALVKGIIALAHSLGMETVAEGVESEAQRGILLSFGCDRMQGYLFGKPTPAADFTQRMQLRRNPAITAGRVVRTLMAPTTQPR